MTALVSPAQQENYQRQAWDLTGRDLLLTGFEDTPLVYTDSTALRKQAVDTMAARLDAEGLLDRTHLRFFTQPTMVALFAQAGWEVQTCTARVFEPEATERALLPLLELAPRLGMDPDAMRLHLSAYQWLVEARRSR